MKENIIGSIANKFFKKMAKDKDMMACIYAGVETEWSSEDNGDGTTTIKLTTKNPVAVKEIDGKTVVFERI